MTDSNHLDLDVPRPVLWLVAALLAMALALRFFSVVYPEVTLDGEQRLAQGVKEPRYDERALGARFYLHVVEARPLHELGLSAERAAFIEAALAGLGALAVAALALARLFGRRAGWAFLALGGLSAIDCSFSVHMTGLSQSVLFLALAILAFTSSRKRWWVAGAVALMLAFAHRYHAGLVILSFAAAVVWHDVSMISREGWLPTRRRLLQRVWVAAIAVAVLVLYELWVSHVFHINHFARLFEHENLSGAKLSGKIVHSNWHWLYIVFRLDPIVWLVIGLAVAASLRSPSASWKRPLASEEPDRFVTPSLLLRWAICLVVALSVFRTLSGMVRQVFPALLVVHMAAAVAVAHAWHRLRGRAVKSVALVSCTVLGLAILGVSAHTWYVPKGRVKRGGEIVRAVDALFPGRKTERLVYGEHYLWSEKGYRVVKRQGRPPDIVVGGDRLMPFILLDEEPAKVIEIRERLGRHEVGHLLSIEDVVYTVQYYVSPPLTAAERDRLADALPLRLRVAMRFLD